MSLEYRFVKWLPLITMVLLVGCAGELDLAHDGGVDDWTAPSQTNDPDSLDPNSPDTITEPLTPGFAIERNEVRLLPFHIRIEKLTRVTGLTAEDPLFDQVWRSRYDLGDHNYGQGIGPDLSWNASKMATWVRALQPLCASEVMGARYNLPQDTAQLMTDAFSRQPAVEEVSELTDAIAGQMLDEAGQYEATCLSVLTSAEFVAQ